MPEKTMIYNITVKGTEEQQGKLGLVDKSLAKISKTRADLMKKVRAGEQLTKEETIALGRLTTQQKKLQTTKQSIIKTISAEQNAVRHATGSYNQLTSANAKLSIRLRALADPLGKNRVQYQKIASQIRKNTDQLKRMDATMGGHQRNVGNYSKAFKAGFAQIGLAIGGVLLAYRALDRIIGGGIRTLAKFEKTLTNVLTLLSKKDIDKFGEQLKTESIRIIGQYGLEIEDVNKALFDTISAGISAGSAIAFMDEAAKLSIGGVTDLSTAVDGMTSIMNAYGVAQADVEKVSAAFFSAQKFGKTTVAELSEKIGEVAPIAKLAGLSFQETLSTLALFTKEGLKTDIAATSLKATITALIKPAEGARTEFERLGIPVGASAIKSEGLSNILVKVAEAAEQDADALTKLIPNVRALTGAGTLTVENMKELDEILKVVNEDYGEGSSLANAYAMQQDTLSQKTEVLKGTWDEFILSLNKGQGVIGKVSKALVESLTGIVLTFTELTKSSADRIREREEKKTKDFVAMYMNLDKEGKASLIENAKNYYRLARDELQKAIDSEDKERAETALKEVNKYKMALNAVKDYLNSEKEAINKANEEREKAEKELTAEQIKELEKAREKAKEIYEENAKIRLSLSKQLLTAEISNIEDKREKQIAENNREIANLEAQLIKKKNLSQLEIEINNTLLEIIKEKKIEHNREIEAIDKERYASKLKKLQDNYNIEKQYIERTITDETEKAKALKKLNDDLVKSKLEIAEAEAKVLLKSLESGKLSEKETEATKDRLDKLVEYITGELFPKLKEPKEKEGFDEKITSFVANLFNVSEEEAEIIRERLNQLGNDIINIYSAIQSRRNTILNEQIKTYDKAQQEELKILKSRYDRGLISDKEYTNKKQAIEEKYDAQREIARRENFEKEKKLAKAQAYISMATAILGILKGEATGNVIADAIIKALLIAAAVVTAGIEISNINKQTYAKGRGSLLRGKKHAQGGINANVEDGESIINAKSTELFKPELSYINSYKGYGVPFLQEGGLIPTPTLPILPTRRATEVLNIEMEDFAERIVEGINEKRVINVEADVTEVQQRVETIETLTEF